MHINEIPPRPADHLDGGARREAIARNLCHPVFGCGGPADEFRDALSVKEFAISGLCQDCQDSVFGA